MCNKIILITTLAKYQTRFWLKVAAGLESRGLAIGFISFDDESTVLINNKGYQVFSDEQRDVHIGDCDFVIEKFGVKDINLWLSHEKYAFDILDSGQLKLRLARYLVVAENAIKWAHGKAQSVIVLQELGGFVSVVACYFAAHRYSIDNLFLEPSFFRGRLFVVRNSFRAKQFPKNDRHGGVGYDLCFIKYLDNTLRHKKISIPSKDLHFYSSPIKKVFKAKNFVRLLEKVFGIVILGRHYEFGHVGGYVLKHIKMVYNSLRYRSLYRSVPENAKIIYFPLHVPADVALTFRAPQYVDQISLIETIAKLIPDGYSLVVKEHPAMIGCLVGSRLDKVVKMFNNIIVANPDLNNFDIMEKSSVVITINSKSGAEALLMGKPVIALGDCFYSDFSNLFIANSIPEIRVIINKVLEKPWVAIDKEQIRSEFFTAWSNSYPGELYIEGDENVERICCLVNAEMGAL